MGGATALGLAQQHPDRVHGIMICDHACKSTPATSQQWEERIVMAREKGMEGLVEPTVARWFPADIREKNPPYIDKVRAMIRGTPVEGFIGCAAALANHDYNCKVETVTCPVLFMVGEKDGTAPAAMKDMHVRRPGSVYVELAGAGHISNMDRPAEFTKAIAAFVAG
jgi:3-oxoadipate enol-lactonase